MFRKALFLAIVVSILLTCSVQAEQIISHWVGDYGIWGDANNWSPPIVPDNNKLYTFVVIIEGDSNEPDIGLWESHTIDRLDCNGTDTVYLANWKGLPVGSPISVKLTLTDDVNGLTNHGYLEIGELDIQGNIKNMAGALLVLENIELVGNLYNQAGGEIEVGGLADIDAIYNDGRVVIDPTGYFYADEGEFRNSGRIEIYGGECQADDYLDNNSTGIIKGFGVIWAEERITNAGQIIAEGGSLAIGIDDGGLVNTGLLQGSPLSSLQIRPCKGFDVNNAGSIIAHAGGGIACDCNLVNDTDGVIKLLGGTLAATTITQTADANFQGQGNITTSNLIIETDGLIRLTGPTNIFGSIQIDPNATLEISDGTTLIKGRTTCNNGTIHMIGGRVICQGGLTNNNCNIIWEPGTYTNIADFNLDGTVNFKDFAYLANAWLWEASWY